jgi:hypothetical protein
MMRYFFTCFFFYCFCLKISLYYVPFCMHELQSKKNKNQFNNWKRRKKERKREKRFFAGTLRAPRPEGLTGPPANAVNQDNQDRFLFLHSFHWVSAINPLDTSNHATQSCEITAGNLFHVQKSTELILLFKNSNFQHFLAIFQ